MGKDKSIRKNNESTLSEYTDFAKKYYGSLDTAFNTEPDEVPYGSICSCNPMNGGSGICGCINGNKMVPNPKKNVRVTETITGNNTIFTNFINNVDKYDELFKLFDYLQEEAKNKRLLAEKSNDPNYYYGMVSAFLDVQSKILQTINKK
jgi:hypothetical protein